MPRNISFSMTTRAVRLRKKTVTRRMGWEFLKPGDVLNACVKCMGLKKGEKPERICQIRVVRVWREYLHRLNIRSARGKRWARLELAREGFPALTPEEFIGMFCKSHKGCRPNSLITRIQFAYL